MYGVEVVISGVSFINWYAGLRDAQRVAYQVDGTVINKEGGAVA